MKVLWGNSNNSDGYVISKWIEENSDNKFTAPYSAIGFYTDKGLEAAAIFNDYNGSNIELHIHAPGRFNRQTISVAFNYVFGFLKVNRLTVKPKRKNKKLLKLLPRLGFVYEYTSVAHYGLAKEEDAIIYKLTPINIPKWIKIDA